MITQEDIIATGTPLSLIERREFLKLPIEQRRRILAQQAEQMAEHYEQEFERLERELWQGCDIIEY